MTEMGLSPQLKMVRISTDSSVAKSFVATRGLGKMRYLELKFLWLQEIVQMGKIRVEKVSVATNIADALTKYHGIDKPNAPRRPHGIVNRRRAPGSAIGGNNHRALGGAPRPLAMTLVVGKKAPLGSQQGMGLKTCKTPGP